MVTTVPYDMRSRDEFKDCYLCGEPSGGYFLCPRCRLVVQSIQQLRGKFWGHGDYDDIERHAWKGVFADG